MDPDEKFAKWGEVGVAPDLFHFYRGYPVKAEFDYNNKVSYVATIPTKERIVFKTPKELFIDESQKAIDKYLEEKQPEYIEYIALISQGEIFTGSLPDLSEALLQASSLDDIRYNLTCFALLELMDYEEPPKPSTLEEVYKKHFYGDDIPIIISVEK